MPKNFREEKVPIESLKNDPSRIYEPLVEAYMAEMEDPSVGRNVVVLPSDIHVSPAFAAPAEHVQVLRPAFTELRRTNEEMMRPIPLLERDDGTLWSYDDTAIIALYRELAPDARILCRIIGRDPAQGETDDV